MSGNAKKEAVAALHNKKASKRIKRNRIGAFCGIILLFYQTYIIELIIFEKLIYSFYSIFIKFSTFLQRS